jgi:hypothetical protein
MAQQEVLLRHILLVVQILGKKRLLIFPQILILLVQSLMIMVRDGE